MTMDGQGRQLAQRFSPATDWSSREARVLTWPGMRREVKEAWLALCRSWPAGCPNRIPLADAYHLLALRRVPQSSACRVGHAGSWSR